MFKVFGGPREFGGSPWNRLDVNESMKLWVWLQGAGVKSKRDLKLNIKIQARFSQVFDQGSMFDATSAEYCFHST